MREGLPADQVIKTGSPMYEVLHHYNRQINSSTVLNRLCLEKEGYFLVSIDREESIDSDRSFSKLVNILNMLAEDFSLPVVVSTHPRTQKRIDATGLSQKPYEQLNFYYRLKDHALFLEKVGAELIDVVPRMTRDFLVSFDTEEQALKAEQQLSKILVNKEVKLFEEIDNRGQDIFVVLTYPSEITDKTMITYSGKVSKLCDLVTFVAIKNGEHQSKGFAYFPEGLSEFAPPHGSHVSKIHNNVLQYFGIRS